MYRSRLLLALLLLISPACFGQTTTVTGTGVDANGNAYFPGTVSAAIVLNAGQPIPPGVPASGSIGPFATTSGGNFSIVVASPLTWIFTLCGTPVNIGPRVNPTPTQACFSTLPVSVSGGSQNITSSLSPLPILGPIAVVPGGTLPNTVLAFSSTPSFAASSNVSYTMTLTGNVISSTITGSPANGNILSFTLIEDATGGRLMTFPANFKLPTTFNFDVTAGATNASTWKFDGTNWNLISNVGGGSGVPQITGQFNVKDFGAIGDAKVSRSTVVTQLGSTITDTTNNPFTSADNGKFIACSLPPGNGSNPINTANGIAQITGVTPPSAVSIAPNTMIGGIGTVGVACVWYTRDDVSSFCCGPTSAFAAAHTSSSGGISGIGGNGPTIISNAPKTAVTCSGGFAVGGYILNEVESVTGTLGVSLIGTGCFIYWLPSSTTGLINYANASQFTVSGLDLYGMGFANSTATTPFIKISVGGAFWLNDNRITNWGSTSTCPGGTNELVEIDSPSGPSLISKNIIAQAGNGGCGLVCTSCSSYPTIDNNYIGNDGGPNMIFNNGLGRNTQGGALVVRNHQGDECGTSQGTGLGNACVQLSNQTVMFEGGILFGPGASLSVDGTSEADLYGMNVGAFTSVGNFPALIMANGGKTFATNTTFRGNGTGVAIQGPGAGSATFNDLGGNIMQNCSSTTCTAASIAQTFAGNVNSFFPLTPTSTTNLGGSQTVSGNAPTACTVTGNGTSTCAFDTGSTNAAWTITITAAGTTTATGTVQFTLNPAMGTNSTSCTANYANGGTGAWNASAISPIFTTNSTTTVAFNINNAGTNLTATSTYKIAGNCYGK